MQTFLNVLIVILVILAVVLGVLYFVGRRMQKKQAVAQEQMEAMKQTVNMLIIDKKRMKLKESGLPQMVIDQTPRYLRGSKVPIVKAKVGPRVMILMADNAIFDSIPVKKEVKAVVSGIYITDVKGLRGGNEVVPQKKKGIMDRLRAKVAGMQKKQAQETAGQGKKKQAGGRR